jgi:hypothetical protein
MPDKEIRKQILALIIQEREKQQKWADYYIDDEYTLVALVIEELGEFIDAHHKGEIVEKQQKLIQVCALLFAYLEHVVI